MFKISIYHATKSGSQTIRRKFINELRGLGRFKLLDAGHDQVYMIILEGCKHLAQNVIKGVIASGCVDF
jgi:hypothetical protein